MSDILGIIPNFFYDLICRIVPGALFIILFWRDLLKPAHIKPVRIAHFTKLFVAAWVIGITLDVSTAQVRIPLKHYFDIPATSEVFDDVAPPQPEEFSDVIRKALVLTEPTKSVFLLEPPERGRSVLRAMADRTLFRLLLVVTILVFLRCLKRKMFGPKPTKGTTGDTPELKCWQLCGLALIFLLCFFGRGYEASIEIEQANKEWFGQTKTNAPDLNVN